MKVIELINTLEVFSDTDEVVIRVSRGTPAVGPTHTVKVDGVSMGIDWDNGKAFLHTTEPVAVQDKQTEYAKKFYDKVIQSWSLATISGDEKNFTNVLKSHFKEMLEYSGMGDYIKEETKKTNSLRNQAKKRKGKKNDS